jgi:hypothetical protein
MASYNLALGQRSGIFPVIILGLYAATFWRRKIPSPLTIVLVGAFVAVLLGFVKMTREDYYIGSDFSHVRDLLTRPKVELAKDLLKGNMADSSDKYHSSEVVLLAGFLRVIPKQVDYDYFVFYTSFLYRWIPRIWWPDRPDPAREKVEELNQVLGQSHRSGSTPTMLGMYYLHWGYFSVFLMAVFTGLYLWVIDAYGRRAADNPAAAVVFVTLSYDVLSMPIGLGPFASLPNLIPFTLFPMLLGFWWVLRKSGIRQLPPGNLNQTFERQSRRMAKRWPRRRAVVNRGGFPRSTPLRSEVSLPTQEINSPAQNSSQSGQ